MKIKNLQTSGAADSLVSSSDILWRRLRTTSGLANLRSILIIYVEYKRLIPSWRKTCEITSNVSHLFIVTRFDVWNLDECTCKFEQVIIAIYLQDKRSRW